MKVVGIFEAKTHLSRICEEVAATNELLANPPELGLGMNPLVADRGLLPTGVVDGAE